MYIQVLILLNVSSEQDRKQTEKPQKRTKLHKDKKKEQHVRLIINNKLKHNQMGAAKGLI